VTNIVRSADGDGLSTQNFQDIGRYTCFPENHWRRMFPRKAFGKIEKQEHTRNDTFGIMTREEALRFTNDFARLTTPAERSLPYKDMVTWKTAQLKEEILHDEYNYTHLQQDVSLSLLDYIEQFEGEEKEAIRHFFMPPGIFDGVVNTLVQ
jgi:hypothetical protein